MEQDEITELEQRHRLGYEINHQTAEEIDEWEDEQVWYSDESE